MSLRSLMLLVNLAILISHGAVYISQSTVSEEVANSLPAHNLAPSMIYCIILFLYALLILTLRGIPIPYIQLLRG